jgi:hypothetical protein
MSAHACSEDQLVEQPVIGRVAGATPQVYVLPILLI